jgi:hypothetical protein
MTTARDLGDDPMPCDFGCGAPAAVPYAEVYRACEGCAAARPCAWIPWHPPTPMRLCGAAATTSLRMTFRRYGPGRDDPVLSTHAVLPLCEACAAEAAGGPMGWTDLSETKSRASTREAEEDAAR